MFDRPYHNDTNFSSMDNPHNVARHAWLLESGFQSKSPTEMEFDLPEVSQEVTVEEKPRSFSLFQIFARLALLIRRTPAS